MPHRPSRSKFGLLKRKRREESTEQTHTADDEHHDQPGVLAPEDIIARVSRGVFVKKMGGGQVNTVSGDFVFNVSEGYLIENGS